MPYLKIKFIIGIILFSAAIPISSQNLVSCDTEHFQTLDSALTQPLWVKKLNLSSYLRKHYVLPKRILEFKNIESLNLNASQRLHANTGYNELHIVSYFPSKLLCLPNWLKELKTLHTISLIGNSKINQANQIRKLEQIDNLQTLYIDPPKKMPKNTIIALGKLKQLIKLFFSEYYVATISDIEKIKSLLPNCEITYYWYDKEKQ